MTDPEPATTPHPSTPDDGGEASISRRRRWLFRLIALLLPVLLLLAVEGVFRLMGYGGYPPVLTEIGEANGRTYVSTVSQGIEPFFTGGGPRGSIERQVVTKPKPAGTVRIFLAGGSAMQGYPQPRHLKLSAFLEAMLSDIWPDRRVEVLNLGTTAVASFPAVCIAEAALDYEPDLIVVYSGNNEFFGAGGVASVHGLGQSAGAMRVLHQARRSALVQGLMASRTQSDAGLDADENLMDVVVAEAMLPPGDPRRQAAAQNLESNLRHLTSRCAARGVPLIVCTCPAMERDLAPIGQDAEIPLPPAARSALEQLIAEARGLRAHDPAAALARYDAALAEWAGFARLHYERAECLTALGRSADAAEAYVQAKDLDTMPWRPPTSSNDAIRRAASDDAVLCDLEEAFRTASADGVIGWLLMDDHVHPSLQGQYVVARSIVQSMVNLDGSLAITSEQAAGFAPWTDYAERLGENDLDAYRVLVRLSELFERKFFLATNPDALERVQAAMHRIEMRMDPLVRDTVAMLQREHRGRPIAGEVGDALLRAKRYREAAGLLAIGRQAAAPLQIPRLRYGCEALLAKQAAGEPFEAEEAAELVHEAETMQALAANDSPYLSAWLGCALHLAGRDTDAVEHLQRGMRFPRLGTDRLLQQVLAKARSKTETKGNDRSAH